jgi:hypothetical protein
MSTTTECPSCGRRLRVPDDLGQTWAQCPSCGRGFSLDSAASSPRPASAELPEHPAITPATGPEPCLSLDDDDARPARTIGVPPPPPPLRAVPVAWSNYPEINRLRRDCEPHRGGLVLLLGIVSLATMVFCPFVGLASGGAAWLIGESDLRLMQNRRMDPSGMGLTRAGLYCGIIGTVLNGLVVIGVVLIGLGRM